MGWRSNQFFKSYSIPIPPIIKRLEIIKYLENYKTFKSKTRITHTLDVCKRLRGILTILSDRSSLSEHPLLQLILALTFGQRRPVRIRIIRPVLICLNSLFSEHNLTLLQLEA